VSGLPPQSPRIASVKALAVAGRAVEVDHHHAVAGAGVDLRVPAEAPAVAERALRAAVDQEGDRVLLARVEVDGLDDEAAHGLVVRADELDPLDLATARARELRVVDPGVAAQVAAAEVDAGQLVGGREAVVQEHHTVARAAQVADGAVVDDRARRAASELEREELGLAELLGGEEEALAVGGEQQLVGGAVPVGGELAGLAFGPGLDHDAEAVSLVAGALHGAVGEGPAVG
jgi:hypothetical protein